MRLFVLIASLLLFVTGCVTRAEETPTRVIPTESARVTAEATATTQPTRQGPPTRTPTWTPPPPTETTAPTATETRPPGPPTRTPSPTSPAAENTPPPAPEVQATATMEDGGGDDNGGGDEEATTTPGLRSTAEARGNLLVNGDFYSAFAGWSMEKGFWRIHDIAGSECAARNPDWPVYMAEMDRDACTSCNVWPVGGEDRLWQDVAAPAHTRVYLTLTEAHHMASGLARVTLYGSTDGANWETVWPRGQPDAEWGAGHHCETPPTFTYTIETSYPFYRVEVDGKIYEDKDGWLVGPLMLAVE